MMRSPEISVIVPVYNAGKYLHRCIDSILAQTFTDFELLLVDDGSKDDSGAICDEYAAHDGRIKVFHKENGGVSSARNVGLDNARGEWICFVDSDDGILGLESVSMGNPEYDMLLFTMKIIGDDGLSVYELLEPFHGAEDTKENYLKSYVYFHVFNSVCSKLIRRSVIKDLRFDPTIKFGEDALFNLRLLKSVDRITVCNNITYIYYREDYGKKYQISLERAIYTMKNIFDAYWELGCRNMIFERNVFECYRVSCQKEWGEKPSLWNNDRIVASVYAHIKDAFSFSFRIKYMLTPTWIYGFYRLLRGL